MAITAAMVKELRELTGAGMMDCKKALGETDGDMDAAVEVLKKSGMAKVEKKASRIAAEGITRVASNGNTAVVVEVNSETDFVAKNAYRKLPIRLLQHQLTRPETEKMLFQFLVCSHSFRKRLLQSVRSFQSEDLKKLQQTLLLHTSTVAEESVFL